MKSPAVLYAAVCLSMAVTSPSFSRSSSQSQIETHARQAQQFLQKGQPDLAVREYDAILKLDPNNVDARGNRGVALFFQDEYAKAVPDLRAVVKQRPNLWNIQALLGMAEKRTGEMPAAQADLERSFPQLQEDKLRIEAGMELVEVYYGAGDLLKAANVIGALQQLAPDNTEVIYTAHRIYSDLAGESMLTMAMVAPKSARMHQMMAQEMVRQGNTEGALAHYREAVKLDPKLPGLRFELAEALNLSESAADQEQIAKAYQAALTDNPFDEKSECRLGDIALRASNLQQALKHYQRAVELQPNDAEASVGVGRVLMQLHRPAEAETYLKRAAQLEPSMAAAHYRLSLVYREQGRTADAQKELAEFQRLKDLKERLKKVYEEMRLQPLKQERGSDAGK